MEKQQLRKLIQNTNNVDIIEALWEFYELKFMTKSTSTTSTRSTNPNPNPYPFSITNVDKSTGIGRNDNG